MGYPIDNTGSNRKDTARAQAISATIPVDTPEQMAHDATNGDVPVANMDWKPPKVLETPPAPAGYHFTWIRTMLGGEEDTTNLSRALQEGYEFATEADMPRDYFAPTIKDARFGQGRTLIGVRDMVLMKITLRKKKQRDAFYASRASDQERRIDQRLAAERARPGDKLFVMERNSRTELRKAPLDDGDEA